MTQALYSRFTSRAFKPSPVAKDIIFNIMEDANHSPSWGNTQPWEIFSDCSGVAINNQAPPQLGTNGFPKKASLIASSITLRLATRRTILK